MASGARGGQGGPGGTGPGGASSGASGKGGRESGGALGRDRGNRSGGFSGIGTGAHGGKAAPAAKSTMQSHKEPGLGTTWGNLASQITAMEQNQSGLLGLARSIGMGMVGMYDHLDPQAAAWGQQEPGMGFDPAGLAAGLGGMAMGVPGLGTAVGALSSAFGHPFGIEAGPGYGAKAGTGGGVANPGSGPGSWRDPRSGAIASNQGFSGLNAGFSSLSAPAGLPSPAGPQGGGLLAGYQLSGPLAQRFGQGGTQGYRFG